MTDRKQIFVAACLTASYQIRVFFRAIKPRIPPFLLNKKVFCKQREKVVQFLLLLGIALDVNLTLYKKAFLLP